MPNSLSFAPVLISLLAAFRVAHAADKPEREITIKNACSETVWPGVANYGEDAPSKYDGKRGWESKSNSEEKIKVPGDWMGQVWARRGCEFDSAGKGTCATGDTSTGLEVFESATPVTGFVQFLFAADPYNDGELFLCSLLPR